MTPSAAARPLLDIPFDDWFKALGLEPKDAYRVRQVQTWVFERRVKTFSEMSDLPQALREKWDVEFRLRTLVLSRREVSAQDGTARLFFEASDGRRFSAVYLPAKGGEGDRSALCLSSQIGCAWGCIFCASGQVPLERNLTSSELVEQVLAAEEAFGHKINSLVFMGMGEPLANFENLVHALQVIRSPLGLNYGARHVTVSTTGLVPQIQKLAEAAPKVNLAISLHAADDETRKKLLPKSSAWTIKDLLRTAWEYQRLTGRGRVTFEYILIKGVNDSEREAQRLANLLRSKKAWVNLIAYNPVAGLPYESPSELAMRAFAKILTERGLFVRLRKPQGTDIAAGCGQLGDAEPVDHRRKGRSP